MKLESSVAVITGGVSGLGEACARMLVKNGGKVALLDLNEERGAELTSELGEAAIFCKTDVTDEATVEAAIAKTMAAFSAIQITINCAGIGVPAKVLSKKGPIPIEAFKKIIDVNLIGTMNVLRLAAHEMYKNGPNADGEKGVVINTSSNAAFDGQIGQAAYSASKSAIVGMTLPIAREFAEYGIRVNTIAPGVFNTPLLASLSDEVKTALGNMIPFPKRLGNPEEFAMLVRQIIENTMINGETIRLDGALRMAAR